MQLSFIHHGMLLFICIQFNLVFTSFDVLNIAYLIHLHEKIIDSGLALKIEFCVSRKNASLHGHLNVTSPYLSLPYPDIFCVEKFYPLDSWMSIIS